MTTKPPDPPTTEVAHVLHGVPTDYLDTTQADTEAMGIPTFLTALDSWLSASARGVAHRLDPGNNTRP